MSADAIWLGANTMVPEALQVPPRASQTGGDGDYGTACQNDFHELATAEERERFAVW